MGFDMQSTADLGKVATVDLKPYKEKELADKARQNSGNSKPPASVKGIMSSIGLFNYFASFFTAIKVMVKITYYNVIELVPVLLFGLVCLVFFSELLHVI